MRVNPKNNIIIEEQFTIDCQRYYYFASSRDFCIADSMTFPADTCFSGIGTAISIPLPSPNFKFASEVHKRK